MSHQDNPSTDMEIDTDVHIETDTNFILSIPQNWNPTSRLIQIDSNDSDSDSDRQEDALNIDSCFIASTNV